MSKRLIYIAIVVGFVLFSNNTKAQDLSLKFGIKAPNSINAGIEMPFEDERVGNYYAELYLSSYPFSLSRLKVLDFFGANSKMTEVFSEPLYLGLGFETGFNFALSDKKVHDYIKINLSVLSLPNTLITDEVINNAFNVDLDSPKYPRGFVREDMSTMPLTLKSSFFNLGLAYSYQLDLRKNSFRFEFELKKTFWSKHRLYSDYRFLTPIEKMTDKELNKMMLKYGWFPSLNFYYVFGLGG